MEQISRRAIQEELAQFVRPNTAQGVFLFALDLGTYVAAIAGVLFLPDLWMKILCSVLAGTKISNLSTIAHDAAHGSLTRSASLNRLIAILSFMPGLFSYRLWLYDHHQLHHPKTNGAHRDSFTPFSPEDFRALPKWRQLAERLYRSPTLLGLGIYYIVERWWQVKFFPRSNMPRRIHASAWRHFAFLIAYLVSFLALLALAPSYSDTGVVTALMLGFAVPFFVWMTLISLTLYVQHTHPRIPWFRGRVDRSTVAPQEALTVHLKFPGALSWFMHHVYDHAAHHVHPGIPCYRLPEAQAHLNALVGDRAISDSFSLSWLFSVMSRCKLYDFERHRWTDFDGRPTTGEIVRLPEDELAPVEIQEVEQGLAQAS